MRRFFQKHLKITNFILAFLVFMLWTLVLPHVTFSNSEYVTFGIKHFSLKGDYLLDRQPLYFLLFVFVPALLMSGVIKKNNEVKQDGYYFSRIGNVVGILNNYLFILSLSSVLTLLKTSRAPLGILYILGVVLSFGLFTFENLVTLGYFPRFILSEETKAEADQKNLANAARLERLEAKTRTFTFFVALSAVLAVIFFIVPLVTEMGTIPLGGDFTQQQIPFYTNGYDDWWRFLKKGEFPLWDSNTFLGTNNVGSNSFYYAFNPFFLPILIFPRDLIPQGISILMIGKFTLAAVTMRMYLKYMGVKETEARIFAIIYAFCGWNAYYLWFNHFMEVAVMFPLIFLGIEKLLKEKKMMTLIFSLGIMGFANYFFLTTVAVLGVIYAGFRYFQLLKTMEPSIIGLGILAFALGILMSSVVLFPSLVVALNSDRVTGATYLDNLKLAFSAKEWKEVWAIISKWETQRTTYDHKKFYPLISYFFPVLSNRSSALLNTSNYDNTISSLFSFSPVILLFIPSLFLSLRKKKVSHFIALTFFLFALFTPFFYNAFHGFTNEYGRWQLIVPFSLITYVAMSLPELKTQKGNLLDLSLLVNLVAMALVVKVAFSFENKNGFSYMYEREYIVFYQFVMLFVSYLFLRLNWKNESEPYFRCALIFLEIAVMGTVTMFGHGYISYKDSVSGGLASYNADHKVAMKIDTLDDSFYRVYNTKAGKGNDNLAMRAGYNGLSTFHSLYNFNLMEFNTWSRTNHNNMGWSLNIYERRTLLYDFLNVKYYVLNDNNHAINWTNGVKTYAPYKNVPNHFSYLAEASTLNRFVYQVNNTFDVGFGVDYAFTYQAINNDGTYTDLINENATSGNLTPLENEELYLQAALLEYQDAREVIRSAPHLGSRSYTNFPRKSYTTYRSNSGLNVNYYAFDDRRYPYEAQLREEVTGSVELPTPEFVMVYGTPLTYNSAPRYLDGSKHVIEYTKSDGTNLLDGPGELIINLPLAYYNSGSSYWNYNYRVFLYDEDYNLITFDDHQSILNSSTSWKTLRAFHSPKSVKKMTLVPLGSAVSKLSTGEHGVFVYPESVLDNIRETSITNTLLDVITTTNKITFKSDYANTKFVVTTIPYDAGWKVRSTDALGNKKDHPVYKVQGGFVGFLSGKGETTYVMQFTPEYFNIGLVLSGGSVVITLLLELNFKRYKNYKKRKEFEEKTLNA